MLPYSHTGPLTEGYYKDDFPFEGEFVLRRMNDFVNVSTKNG